MKDREPVVTRPAGLDDHPVADLNSHATGAADAAVTAHRRVTAWVVRVLPHWS